MQLETGHPICSLCKRELTGFSFESAPGARLCEECRGLIQVAFNKAEPRVVAASGGVQLSGAGTAYIQTVQSDAAHVVRPETISPGFFEDFSASSDQYDQNQQTKAPTMNDESFQMHFEDEPLALDSEASAVDASVLEATEDHHETRPAAEPSSEAVHSELSELRFSVSDSGNHNDQSVTANAAESAISREHVADEIQATQSIAESAPADPWEDPLPAWDYSRNEWPVLMAPAKPRSFAKFKVPAAVILILVFGAGFYYLIYAQFSRDHSPANSVSPEAAPEARAATQKPAEPLQPVESQLASTPSAPSATPASGQARPDQKPNRDEAVSSQSGNTQGRFALQAAAFPTQAGADEFAEKLKSAGVPSYVVSADLARRGRWFRVRVGRFDTAEDAQRFAGEAQLRAKAAGMSLQLIVSPYDQP